MFRGHAQKATKLLPGGIFKQHSFKSNTSCIVPCPMLLHYNN